MKCAKLLIATAVSFSVAVMVIPSAHAVSIYNPGTEVMRKLDGSAGWRNERS